MSNLINKYFDLAKIVLWSDAPDAESKRARLIFNFRDGNPRITVYTGAVGPEGVISYPCEVPTMVAILNLMKDVAKAEPGVKYSIDSLTTVYQDNRPTNEKRVVSTLYVGKSKEGLVYLSVITEGRPKLVFTIAASQYHTFRDGDKNLLPSTKVSEMLTMGIADTMLNVIAHAVMQYSSDEYTAGIRKASLVKQVNGQPVQQTPQSAANIDVLKELEDIGL